MPHRKRITMIHTEGRRKRGLPPWGEGGAAPAVKREEEEEWGKKKWR
jgi:hypothetical protein